MQLPTDEQHNSQLFFHLLPDPTCSSMTPAAAGMSWAATAATQAKAGTAAQQAQAQARVLAAVQARGLDRGQDRGRGREWGRALAAAAGMQLLF